MADASTTRYAFVKPEVGASADSWGGKLNADMDDLDALLGAITTTGSSNAYVLTTGLSLAAYVTGQTFKILASFSNSSTVTIAVDGLAAKAITKNGTTALASGDIVSGNIYEIAYDGTRFQLVGATATGVYQPLDATLTALAGLTTAASQYLRATGTDAFTMDSYATVLSNIGALNNTSGDARYAQLAAANTFTTHQSITVGGKTLRLFNDGSNIIIASTTSDDVYFGANNKYPLSVVQAAGDVRLFENGVSPTGLSANSAGFRSAGPVNVKTADYTTALTDEGHALDMNSPSTPRTITVKASTHTANAELFGVNMGAAALTIARDTGVTFRDSTGTNANLTVTQYQNWYARRDPSTDNLWYVRTS